MKFREILQRLFDWLKSYDLNECPKCEQKGCGKHTFCIIDGDEVRITCRTGEYLCSDCRLKCKEGKSLNEKIQKGSDIVGMRSCSLNFKGYLEEKGK